MSHETDVEPIEFIDKDTQDVLYAGPWAIHPSKNDIIKLTRYNGNTKTYKVHEAPTYEFEEIEEIADDEGTLRYSWRPPKVVVVLKEQ